MTEILLELRNASSRHDFIAEQIARIKTSAADRVSARKHLQDHVEAATSLKLDARDRAALRAFLNGVAQRLRAGEIDERTAHSGINRLLMAARSNNPDVLHIIYAGA